MVVVVVGGGVGGGGGLTQQPGFSNENACPEHGNPIGQVLAPQGLGMQGNGQGAGSQVGKQMHGIHWNCSTKMGLAFLIRVP